VGRRSGWQPAKFSNHGVLIIFESGALQIIILIEHFDELLELIGHEQRAKAPAVRLLNVD
jgi:hypothetical protein